MRGSIEILGDLAAMGTLRRGQLTEQTYPVKGRDGRPRRQGPYYVLTWSDGGEKRTRRVPAAEAPRVLEELARGREARCSRAYVPGGEAPFPLDEALGIVGGCTPPMASLLSRAGAMPQSYDAAGEMVTAASGVRVTGRRVHRLVSGVADAEAEWAARRPKDAAEHDVINIQADMTGLPLRREDLAGVAGRDGRPPRNPTGRTGYGRWRASGSGAQCRQWTSTMRASTCPRCAGVPGQPEVRPRGAEVASRIVAEGPPHTGGGAGRPARRLLARTLHAQGGGADGGMRDLTRQGHFLVIHPEREVVMGAGHPRPVFAKRPLIHLRPFRRRHSAMESPVRVRKALRSAMSER